MPKAKPAHPVTSQSQIHTAEAAFTRLQPRLDDIALNETEPAKIDLQAAAVQTLHVAEVLSAPQVRSQIVAIAHAGVLDLSLLDDLEPVAWATWYARYRFLQASATHSEAALPASLVEQGFEVRGRMLKTLAYHLDGNAEAMAQLAYIRSGSGYLDLANDLSGTAELYGLHHAVIQGDTKNFRETDAADAIGLSERILRLLGAAATPEQTQWRGYAARAAKLLFRHYDEAIRVGRFIFYYDDPEGRFPNLYTATRATAGARREKKVEDGANEQAPIVTPETP